jgi:putative selenium metabolism protein SsnA
MGIVIANGTLASLAPRMVRRANMLIEGDVVAGIFDEIPPGEHEIFDVDGALVMPGNVCAHTHLYSVLARGMPAPPKTPHNFPEILEYIWWRLDRALDEPSIRSSALIGSIDALKAGTTTLIDHHASPNCIEGSLDMLAEEMTRAGVRGILCYEVTDRNGADGSKRGWAENERFARDVSNRFPTMRAMFGAHASFTLEDETLDAIAGSAKDLGVGVHIHVAEDVCDQNDSLQRSGKRVAHRLDDHGIVDEHSLLAHGVHLDLGEIALIGRRKSWMAHNCRSNLNNGVGRAPVPAFLKNLSDPGGLPRAALGTDGIDQDMFSESRTAYFRSRESSLDAYAEQFTDMLASGAELVSRSFGRPVGKLEPGHLADIQIYDYTPPTPLTAGNLAWHWMFAFTNYLVKDVMVGGRWVLRNRSMVNLEGGEARAHAREQAQSLWKRMEELPL